MATRADPDQTPHSAASDLGLHCLLRLAVPLLRVHVLRSYLHLTVNSQKN